MTTYLLPGMGATSEMYQDSWRALKDCVYLDWPSYAGEDTLRQIAERIIIDHKLIATDNVGGSSMGGMVALEIAALLQSPTVYLIGSATCRQEIHGFLQMLSPLAQITPLRLLQILAGKSNCTFSTMFVASDTDFIRAMCKAIGHWDGCDYSDEKIQRVHGMRDLVIPCPKNITGIPGAGHLIAMTHADACIETLKLTEHR